jgi:phosphoadenosine phosphosulfate reductase
VDFAASPVKICPLADWTREQLDDYIRRNDVPMHPLYALNYTSIGCDPCTRAVDPGEGERAGRWWWEQDTDKECGIHFTADGRAQRTVDVLLEQVLGNRRA